MLAWRSESDLKDHSRKVWGEQPQDMFSLFFRLTSNESF
jgi:hypothetical protein